MRRVSEEEQEKHNLHRDAVCVEGKEVTKIGNPFDQSETKALQAVAVDKDDNMILWDAPGFEDSYGVEKQNANAVNSQRLLKASSLSTCGGFVIHIVLDAPSLEVGRGEKAKKTMEILWQLFGGKAQLKNHLHRIVFCITKSSRSFASLDVMKN